MISFTLLNTNGVIDLPRMPLVLQGGNYVTIASYMGGTHYQLVMGTEPTLHIHGRKAKKVRHLVMSICVIDLTISTPATHHTLICGYFNFHTLDTYVMLVQCDVGECTTSLNIHTHACMHAHTHTRGNNGTYMASFRAC